jgi:hypothetical protein
MITFIILLAFIILGIYLAKTHDFDGWDFVGMMFATVGGICIVIHLLAWGLRSYDYELFFTQRQAFEMTLHDARQNNNPLEVATIVGKVAEWNEELASSKYNNSTLFLDQYIDDRIDTLEPIK